MNWTTRTGDSDLAAAACARLYSPDKWLVTSSISFPLRRHEGPGKHDDEYINYVGELVKMMAKYDIKVYVDPHQASTWMQCTSTHAILALFLSQMCSFQVRCTLDCVRNALESAGCETSSAGRLVALQRRRWRACMDLCQGWAQHSEISRHGRSTRTPNIQ